ncbi:nitrate/sulfonate/bicarbonate ABC transporter ATP-binding protein [Fictibacillus phosphorivorans]|uniref:Nitrate/sulfonate/bicarbonate ABC transporter ATP-binding protein n=1 Tax=Fictibacillus phosphorivorans TaxID=1221500 RepID=A0A163SDZ2_9BACL|nr:ABC transporter ATP-binding protein [Fictibacillus phosphorivorans]KZE68839.1 nitrate/sulfonate/bicarbonate ABC transporter ATP-binding protein [Fictibacillus phosphorivorans]
MLNVKRLKRMFNNNQAGFHNINFSVDKGEIIGILGTSGCGKSTLLRVLSGLDPYYEGNISSSDEANNGVGMMFQEPRLLPWLSVRKNISFGLKKEERTSTKYQTYLDLVGLTGFENHYPKDLSGGMAQRTAIARALITEPEVLLLDEPFSALDAFTKMQLQDLLLSIWQKKKTTMLLVTHDIDEALYLCDRILILKGQPGEVFAEVQVERSKPRTRGDAYLSQQKAHILNLLNVEQKAAGELK